MRIAQIAPLTESVPPKLYGGTERIVSFLTDELVGLGHEVTLFASGDSVTSAKLEAMCPRALRLDSGIRDHLAPQILALEQVFRRSADFDVLHFHVDYLSFPLFSRQATPFLTTLHGRLDMPEIWPLYEAFPGVPLVSISDAQRVPMPWAKWAATIHHGIPENLLTPLPAAGPSYLAFLGRIAPEKRVDRAIEIARRAGLPLRIAAKVDAVDRAYFHDQIEPLLDTPGVEFIGEISDEEKSDFLGGAIALLFPIDWPEPFGLVMIEAMACGTPVIAWNCGSVPEVIEDGRTGFIVADVAAAAEAVGRIPSLPRDAVRRRFEERFTARRMALDYEALYRRLGRAVRMTALAAE